MLTHQKQSFAKRFPIGDVVTNDLKKSITRETSNQFLKSFDVTNTVSAVTNNNNDAILTFTEEHGLEALKVHNVVTGGNGHTDGTYFNIRLLDNNNPPASSTWRGATANVTVASGSVQSVTIVKGGSAYKDGHRNLFFDSSLVALGGIAGSASAKISINTGGISTALGNYVQVTGITTGFDSYHRITSVNNDKSITLAKTPSETILVGQQVIDLDLGLLLDLLQLHLELLHLIQLTHHGMVVGNKFRVLNSSDTNLGDFIVTGVGNTNQFTANTVTDLTDPKYILKHGLSDNEALSSKEGENLGVRGLSVFDHDTLVLDELSHLLILHLKLNYLIYLMVRI